MGELRLPLIFLKFGMLILLPWWRNWYTRTPQKRIPQGLGVRISPTAQKGRFQPRFTHNEVRSLFMGAGVIRVFALFAPARADPRARRILRMFSGAVLGVGVVGLGGTALPALTHSAQPPTHYAELYPPTAVPVVITDLSSLTAVEILGRLRETSRFYLLLYNSGTLSRLDGTGPYTVFAPADPYFDRLPKGAVSRLTTEQAQLFALRHIVARALPLDTLLNGEAVTLAGDTVPWVVAQNKSARIGGPPGSEASGFVLRGYRAKNGIVYVITKVLMQ